MDRLLLDSNWNDGYPLCLETLQILQNNVQLLEKVLNGFKLPQHTIVRFPVMNGAYFAYVQCNSSWGEILQIDTGANIANSQVTSYHIVATDYDIEDATNDEYSDVYQTRRLTLVGNQNDTLQGTKVINFSELIDKALWQTHSLRSGTSELPYIGQQSEDYSSYVNDSPVISVESNDKELRIRICLLVTNLPISGNSEFRMVFKGDCLDNADDIFPVLAAFNGNSNSINRSVSACVTKYQNTNNRFEVKISTHELYEADNTVSSFTGRITVNAVLYIHPIGTQGGIGYETVNG